VFAPSFPFVIIAPQFFREDFAQDLNPKLAAEMAADQHPTSLAILGSPSARGAWHDLLSWYAVSGADRVIDPALQRFMAQRAGSTTVQFDDASHAGGFTHYATRFVKLSSKRPQRPQADPCHWPSWTPRSTPSSPSEARTTAQIRDPGRNRTETAPPVTTHQRTVGTSVLAYAEHHPNQSDMSRERPGPWPEP
jgi:Alpha/beta hydrolase family